MVNINIVKDQYRQMHDEQLILFAKNESQNLTIESFHALKDELEKRNIDSGILEQMQVEKDLQDANKISEFEKVTAFEFTKNIWEFAFNEKEKGTSDAQLFIALTNKNINPEYAGMLIQTIEPRAKEILDGVEASIIAEWIAAIFGGLVILFKSQSPNIFLFGGIVIFLGAIVGLANSYSRQRKLRTILKNIETEKNNPPANLYQ